MRRPRPQFGSCPAENKDLVLKLPVFWTRPNADLCINATVLVFCLGRKTVAMSCSTLPSLLCTHTHHTFTLSIILILIAQKRARHNVYAKLIFSNLFNTKFIAIPVTHLLDLMSRIFPELSLRNTHFLRALHIPSKITLLLYLSMPLVNLHTTRYNIQKFYMVLTLRFCVLYGSQNKSNFYVIHHYVIVL
jgi:hypothetical protein